MRQLLLTCLVALFAITTMNCAQAKATPSALKLYTFDCGTLQAADMDGFSSAGDYANTTATLAGTCFLVRHKKGDLLWDTGLPGDIASQKSTVSGNFTLSMGKTLVTQLFEIGLKPADVEFVTVSHGHFDHTGQVGSFPSSTWLVHKKEVEAMFAKRNAQKRFADFIPLKRKTFTGDYDVFGDGSVVILQMPGHTPGHTALKVMLAKTGPVLISGDLYHQAKSRKLKRVPSFNDNEVQTRESMARFEKMARELGAKVIVQHEQADVTKLPALPRFLD